MPCRDFELHTCLVWTPMEAPHDPAIASQLQTYSAAYTIYMLEVTNAFKLLAPRFAKRKGLRCAHEYNGKPSDGIHLDDCVQTVFRQDIDSLSNSVQQMPSSPKTSTKIQNSNHAKRSRRRLLQNTRWRTTSRPSPHLRDFDFQSSVSSR